MVGSIFGSNSQFETDSSSPPLPQAAAFLSQAYSSTEIGSEQKKEAATSSHSRRPSLRMRLKLGKSAEDKDPRRPSTPEIESWKQRSMDPAEASASDSERRSRASIDGASRPKPADSPVKITRSRSTVRRKPAPEVKQEEIDSSSSTPVYTRTMQTLDVDPNAHSPLGGSLASSPATQPAALAGSISDIETSPRLSARIPSPSANETALKQETAQMHGLGLIGASVAPAYGAGISVPSIDVRPSTPSREASPVVANGEAQQKPTPTASSPLADDRRRSSGVQSVADTSLSVDRPWSLISASEADTPLLKLRKLVVDTKTPDDSRDGDDANNGLFFRPMTGTTGSKQDELAALNVTQKEIEPESDVQMRSISQATTRSDTKHEVSSMHSSDPSLLGPAPSLAAQSTASQASTIRMRQPPAGLSHFPETATDSDVDSVGPLPAKSPAASQHSFRVRQHRRDNSTGSAHSQATIQQAKRASTASRITVRSSGHWSESRLSEDALSALEAEVGQARRAEVVALGKGRVKDWVGGGGADRPLPMTEAPTLSRSNTLRKKSQAPVAEVNEMLVDEKEAERQRALNEHLSRRLLQLSDAQVESDVEIRDISHEKDRKVEVLPAQHQFNAQSSVTSRFARLSAFNDRKPVDTMTATDPAAIATNAGQAVEEAIRLGRAPSKRVRHNVSEATSLGEAVMVTRGSPATTSLLAARRRSTSLSARKTSSTFEQMNPTLVPALPTMPQLHASEFTAPTAEARERKCDCR